MSAAATAVTAADRLGLTLFLAAALHGLVILGVGFAPLEDGRDTPRALDVVLVQQHTDEPPDEADFLANANAAGGGNSEQRERPRAPVSSPEQAARAGLAPAPLEAGAPQPEPPAPRPVLTRRAAERKALSADEPRPTEREMRREQPEPMEYEARIARLAAEVDDALSRYARRPRKMFLTARTRQSDAATYMHDWVRSVERIGNLNYPEAARDRGLSGALVLVVAVKADGSLHEVRVQASSGQPVLDAAAKRIVRLAAPFEPFPDALRERTDLLYITRTWEFSAGALTTRAGG
ncbi:MAG: TonB family protein [Halofilum sp. (in: g-proteobacteria)]|nr:TonB family protein [Halofilum sp. (in: g-proteobacteria)]